MIASWFIPSESWRKITQLLLFLFGFSTIAVAQSEMGAVHLYPPGIATFSTKISTFRTDVDLVLVNVTVLDRSYRAVSGLQPQQFLLWEDQKPQSIKYFSSADQPLSLVIVLDASASMAPRFAQARKAAVDLVRTGNALDEISVIAVGDTPDVEFSFDDRIDSLPTRLELIQPDGRTALWDSMVLGLRELEHGKFPRRAMVVISDGGDNHSTFTESELKTMVAEADIELYAVGLFDRFPRRNEERNGSINLDELAGLTGGRLLSVHDEKGVLQAVTEINDELRNQYVLGYVSSSHPHDGLWHKLRVTLGTDGTREKLRISSKKGYFAPSE